MNGKWELESIYPGVDCKELREDISLYRIKTKELKDYAENMLKSKSSAADNIEGFIRLYNGVILCSKPYLYLSLVLSADSENADALKLFESAAEIAAEENEIFCFFREYLKSVDTDKLYNESSLLREHKHFIETEKRLASHSLSPEAEAVVSKMKQTGSESWQKLWENISSSLVCSLEGRSLSLSEVRSLAYSSDPTIRKAAYSSELKAYENIKTVGAFCLNSIKGEVLKECSLRGYESPLEASAEASGIDKDILFCLLDAIEENIGELNEFYRIKAKYLKRDKLPFCDLFAPVGGEELKFTFDEAKELVIKAFNEFSPSLADFAREMTCKDRVDIYPRKGKVGGAFCESIKAVEQSRILMNFTGSFEDVVTLAHELGHGWHNEILKGESPINSDYPMTLAETASAFCENLIFKAAEKSFSEGAVLTVKESRLSGELQSIIDIYSRFLFEDSFFKERASGSLSADEICSLMINAQKRAYSGGLDPECLHPFMWLCKPHYYDAGFNYYNYPYAFGDIFARSLFAAYEKKGKAFSDEYQSILKNTGKLSVKEVGRLAGADFCDRAFWDTGIKAVLKDISDFRRLAEGL